MTQPATKLPVKTDATQPSAPREARAPFESLRKEIDRLFDEFNPFRSRSRTAGSSIFDLELPRFSHGGWPVSPAIDLAENEAEYEITAELPGIDEKNVEIKVANNTLTIKGEKKEEKEEKEKDYYLSERRYGSFQRSFQIPDSVDAGKIEASFAKGLLTVKLPKTTEAQKAAKKIEIKAA
jgi:HSP20 family protein